MQVPIKIRLGKIEEKGLEGLVFHSWIRSYSKSPTVKMLPKSLYDREQHYTIDRLLERSTVYVVGDVEDPNHLLGWACIEEDGSLSIVHYVYIKSPFRRFKIASRLIEALCQGRDIFHTHSTQRGNGLARKVGSIYNPYLIGGRYADQVREVTSSYRDRPEEHSMVCG